MHSHLHCIERNDQPKERPAVPQVPTQGAHLTPGLHAILHLTAHISVMVAQLAAVHSHCTPCCVAIKALPGLHPVPSAHVVSLDSTAHRRRLSSIIIQYRSTAFCKRPHATDYMKRQSYSVPHSLDSCNQAIPIRSITRYMVHDAP